MRMSKCKNCDFEMQIAGNTTYRKKLKIYKEDLVLANLFACDKCIKKIQNKIKELNNENR